MGIFEIATQLGEELKKDERLVRLEAAKKAYEENAALQKQLVEFEVQQRAMQQEIVKEEKDMQFIEIIQKRIDDLYKSIVENPVFVELNEAQEAVNELMNSVNNTIMFAITGEVPSCTHNCSTCGGACSH